MAGAWWWRISCSAGLGRGRPETCGILAIRWWTPTHRLLVRRNGLEPSHSDCRIGKSGPCRRSCRSALEALVSVLQLGLSLPQPDFACFGSICTNLTVNVQTPDPGTCERTTDRSRWLTIWTRSLVSPRGAGPSPSIRSCFSPHPASDSTFRMQCQKRPSPRIRVGRSLDSSTAHGQANRAAARRL